MVPALVTTAMEEGTLQALTFLSYARLVQRDRVLVLRTGSNYDQQGPGLSEAEIPALESAWGGTGGGEIVQNWGEYRDPVPSR